MNIHTEINQVQALVVAPMVAPRGGTCQVAGAVWRECHQGRGYASCSVGTRLKQSAGLQVGAVVSEW